jgi:hypothetical protein
MSNIVSLGRADLPQEFFDFTSTQLLIQPEPQYLHARLLREAMRMEMDRRGAMLGLPGRELVDNSAPYLQLDQMQLELSDRLYAEAIKVDLSFMESPLGKLPIGHIMRLNRPQFVNTTYTLASREIAPGRVISTTPIKVGSDQVEFRIARYGGPLDPVSGQVAPIGISRFDAQRSVHSLPAIRDLQFKRDYDRFIDSVGVALFDNVDTGNVLYNSGFSADNDMQGAGDSPFSYELLRHMDRRLEETNIPRFANGRRMAVLTPLQAEQLTRDSEYERLVQLLPPKNPILVASYVGTVSNVDIFRSNTLTIVNNSNSVPVHRAQMIGPGMAGVAPGEMPRVEANTNDNYGEDPIAIWLQYVAFATLDARFGVSGRSD